MSNPGPAVTNSIHPQNLGTNQALRLLAVSKGVSLASDTDTAVNVINTSSYVPATVLIANANNAGSAISSPASVYFGIYNAPSQGNTTAAIFTTATLPASFTSTTYVDVVAASYPALAQTAQTLYVNVATATVSGTVDVYVYGYDLSGPQQ